MASLGSLPLAVLTAALAGSWTFHLLCLQSALRWRRARTAAPEGFHPPVTILKPLCGPDPDQLECLRSFLRQDYPAWQVVFGALDPQDPALETARRAAAEHPGADVAIVSGGEAFGANRKVCNLASMLPAARHGLLVISDSDMRVGPDYLRRVTAPFADPQVGLVTCPYRGSNPRGLPAVLEALGIGADFIPSVLLTNRFWGMRFAFGSTIALRRETLDAIGGFHVLAQELADDYLLGSRVHTRGLRVVLCDYVVDDVLGQETFGEMWTRRLRWARTTRALHPGPTLGAGITHGTVLAVLLAAASGLAPWALGLLGATLAVRAATATLIARRCTQDPSLPRFLPALPLSDLVSFGLWAGSFLGNRVRWRGELFRVERGGRLTPMPPRRRRAI